VHRPRLLLLLGAAILVTACGNEEGSSDDRSAVTRVVHDYLAAVSEGEGMRACGLLTEETQLTIFDYRLVHVAAKHPRTSTRRSSSIGAVAGLAPAIRAASVSPTEALRTV